jgi:hypothetical protein
MSQILRFATNIPEEVSLRSTAGKRVEGRYGEQMMYALHGDRIMYVPLTVAERIQELDLAAGEAFEICKTEVKNGNRKWIEWRVRKYDEPSAPVQSGDARSPEGHSPAPPNGAANGSNGHANGGAANFEAAWDGTLLPAPIHGPGVTVMEVAMNAAAEIAQRVEGRAAMRNYQFRFTSEDIRAIGLTMFIQAGREGGFHGRLD